MEEDKIQIPSHIAIIVDGNGRWAVAKGKSRSEGHKEGAKRLEEIITYAFQKGVKTLSLYVFSTENFSRSKEEVDYLMKLLQKELVRLGKRCNQEEVRVVFSGREEPLSKDFLHKMRDIENQTKQHKDKTVNFCINYGGKAELVDACKKIGKEVQGGSLSIEDITEDMFSSYLYHTLPPVDFMIRTSGEQRISNFLPWLLSYAEFYFPDTLFPDFDEKEFDKAILAYNKRNRRFGGNK